MKKLIFIFCVYLLSGCSKSYVQLMSVNSDNSVVQNDLFVYESDSVILTYGFWNEKGLVSFSIYNKLDVPIYIDWKKSSYVDNDVKLDYWSDVEITNTNSITRSYLYTGASRRPGNLYPYGVSAQSSVSTVVKPERITFIPPKSTIYKSQFIILPSKYFDVLSQNQFEILPRNDKKSVMTKVFYKDFAKDKSPLIFRNFISFSLNEDFRSEFYVDNLFYIGRIEEMDKRHFEYVSYESNSLKRYTTIRPYMDEKKFYVTISSYGNKKLRKVQ